MVSRKKILCWSLFSNSKIPFFFPFSPIFYSLFALIPKTFELHWKLWKLSKSLKKTELESFGKNSTLFWVASISKICQIEIGSRENYTYNSRVSSMSDSLRDSEKDSWVRSSPISSSSEVSSVWIKDSSGTKTILEEENDNDNDDKT